MTTGSAAIYAMRLAFRSAILAVLLLCARVAHAADAWFMTSDHVRLHVIQAGDPRNLTIVFVPGWTMPAWIFQAQIRDFAPHYHVVALDPRGQGESEIAPGGYDYLRRGQDIADLVAALGNRPIVLVGWSLGVLDSLSYIAQYGDSHVIGLVLIDNSIGENPAPMASRPVAPRGPALSRDEQMRRFVRGMFRVDPGQDYLARLTDDALRTPAEAAKELANYAVPRTYWRRAVYSVAHPILYVVRPRFAAQAANLAANDALAETVTFADAGHALFVDEAPRFDALLAAWLRRRVWPADTP